VLEDIPKPHNSPVFVRGDAGNKGPVVPRQFLEVLSAKARPAFTNGSGRLDLAWAIASKDNPITPRVLVNRVWLHHFGEGFVPTPDDFGTMSEPPSHPELLDYLASRFVQEGWSIKKLHRWIMLSSTYQETSANDSHNAQVDPANRLLWRANIRRLDIEALRDSLLSISGALDPAMYGRPVDFDQEPGSARRTIYGRVDRSDVMETLISFDFANPDLPTGRRYETTVPQQALFLMNSPLVVEQAKRLVALPGFRACESDTARVQFLYERIYQRLPHSEEVQLARDFVAKTPEPASGSDRQGALRQVTNFDRPRRPAMGRPGGRGAPPRQPRYEPLTPWEEYAHALLQANETSFVN